MAKSRQVPDEFPNVVYASCTESAANTLTFQQLQTGYGSLQKTAWILSRVEYYLSQATLNELAANDDYISLALTTSNLISSLTLQSASVVDLLQIQMSLQTAVGFHFDYMPLIRDFSSLPGGGRLVLPYPLYLAVAGASLANPITAASRLFFTERELGDSEWMELVQETRLLT